MDCVYLLRCADGSLYAGWTNDLPKRLAAHQSGHGCKYTRSHLPVQLVYTAGCTCKTDALRLEAKLKRLPRAQKLRLLAGEAWASVPKAQAVTSLL